MRNLIRISLAAVGGLALHSNSAEAQRQRPEFGIIGGVTMSRVTGPVAKEFPGGQESKVGFLVGPTLSFRAMESWGVESGLLYIKKGGRFVFDTVVFGQPFSGSATIRHSYLELPLLARVRLGKQRPRATPHLLFGPYIAASLSCHGDIESDQDPSQNSSEECQGVQSTDIGGVVGLNVALRRLILGLRGERSLRNISSDPADEKGYYRVVSVTVGIPFGRH